MESKSLTKWKNKIFCLVATILILILYGQTIHYDFVDMDDPHYVYYNKYVQQGITKEGIKWAFDFDEKGGSYWHPLTWVSHMIDVSLFGSDAGYHHLVNVMWHIINTCLLFYFLIRATGAFWASALVALLFALHAVNVESVAWVSERKNLLSTFFWLAILLAYVSYTKKTGVIKYLVLSLLFITGLMVKPMLVTLPFVLLLLDYWPLERLHASGQKPYQYFLIRRFLLLTIEKIPLLLLALLAAYVVTESMGEYRNIVTFSEVPLLLRLENFFVSYSTYIVKLLWPSNLGAFHPYPDSLEVHLIVGSIAIICFISFFVFFIYREKKYLTVGWLWFLGTLVPVSGLMQAGVWPAWAERWAYIPYIGLFIMLSWWVLDAYNYRRFRPLFSLCIALFLIFHGVVAWRQVHHWQNSITLYRNTLKANPKNTFAELGLANALAHAGDSESSPQHYYKAFTLNFDKTINLQLATVALTKKHLNSLAIEVYKGAQKKGESIKNLNYYLGLSYGALEQYDNAKLYFNKELELNSEHPQVLNALALTYQKTGDSKQAVIYFNKAFQESPNDAFLVYFADALTSEEKYRDAMKYYQLAFKQSPENDEILIKMGNLLLMHDMYQEAYSVFMKAFSLKPETIEIHDELINIFIKQQQIEETAFRSLQKVKNDDVDPTTSIFTDIANRLEDYNRAERKMSALLKYIVKPKDDGLHESVLQAKTRDELIQKMIDTYLQKLESKQKNYDTIIGIAQLYEQLGNRERSIFYYNKALELEPGNYQLHYNLANLLVAENQNIEAEIHYNKALEINPTFMGALNNLGIFYARANKYEQALIYFEKAVATKPSFVEGHKNITLIFMRLGNKERALYHIEKAAALAPKNKNILLLLEKVQAM